MQAQRNIITVGAVCCRDGRFLLIEENVRDRLVVTQPSGHWEPGESLVQAVVRETLEESGHDFEPVAVGGVYFWRHPTSGESMTRINFIGEARPPSHPVTLDEGIERYVWRTRTELINHSTPLRNTLVLRTVDDFLADKRYPLSILQHFESDWIERHASAA